MRGPIFAPSGISNWSDWNSLVVINPLAITVLKFSVTEQKVRISDLMVW